jgi:hypothetical protein
MGAHDFANSCKRERDAMFAEYSNADGKSAVAACLRSAALTEPQRQLVLSALDSALTDAFYTMLTALDGAASLNDRQQAYHVTDEAGREIFTGDGRLEAAAFSAFHGDRT